MKKLCGLLVLTALLCGTLAAISFAQEVIYIGEPSVYNAPTILPRLEAPVKRDFVRNPALIKLDCPYEFFSDVNYHGGTYKTSAGGEWGPDSAGWAARGYGDSSYYLHALGGDAGFAMKLNDSTNLAALLSYRWGLVVGDTDFEDYHNIWGGSLYGSWEERLNTHTVGLSVLLNHAFSDAVTLGAGLNYSYDTERFGREGSGDGIYGGARTETLAIDRETELSYHRLAPVVGILLSPTDRVKIDASVEAGFAFGHAGVKSDLADVHPTFTSTLPTYLYSDDAGSDDLAGWDIAAKVRPTITVNDKMTIPIVLDFTYRRLTWSADGASSGYFAPVVYGGIFQGPGTIDYENDTRIWDATLGAGLTYDAGWATMAGMLSYTHSNFRNGYDLENAVSGSAIAMNGMTAYTQRDTETKDVVSLGLMVEKRFSPAVSAALGLTYAIGWGDRTYYVSYRSPWDDLNRYEVILDLGGQDMYQDLTLTTGLTLTPTERLTVAFGGMVKIPLDSLDYEMDGRSVGWRNPPSATPRWPYDSYYGRDYESSGWEYGGTLTLTYEFGCATVVPPTAPAPVIAPKLEPMSSR